MIIQDLPSGQAVKLEIDWGDKQFELDTEVIGSNPQGLLIRPYIYNGLIINIPDRKKKDLTFHLYAIDEKGGRVGWRNINVATCEYRGRTYYACSPKAFNRNAEDEDRRIHLRTSINVKGIAEFRDGSFIEVTVKDISDNGIAFWVPMDFNLPTNDGYIKFNDYIRGVVFAIELRFQKVRAKTDGDRKLIGASVYTMSKKELTYVFLKRSEEQNT